MAGDSLDSRTARLGLSLFQLVLLVISAAASLIKGLALYVAGWADELSEGCLAIVANGASQEGRVVAEPQRRNTRLPLTDAREETMNEGTIRSGEGSMTDERTRTFRRQRLTSPETRVQGTWVVTDEGCVIPHTFSPLDVLTFPSGFPIQSPCPTAAYTSPYLMIDSFPTISPVPSVQGFVSAPRPLRRSPRFRPD